MTSNGRQDNSTTAAAEADRRRTLWITFLVAGAFFMENLDGTVITTAVPDIARSFGVAPLDLGVGVSVYLLTLGVFIPISGWVAGRYGPRRVFAAALAIFTLASVLCGLAQGLTEFVLLRALQGAGGAMMVPVGRLLVLSDTPKERLISVIATLTWPALVAPVLGPAVGGFITSYASWRWIFYLNLPLGLIALALALQLIPERPPAPRKPFDWPGFVLGGGAILCLTWGAGQLSQPDAPWCGAGGFFCAGLVLLAVEIWHLRRAAHPLLDLSMLKTPTFAVTIFGGSLFRMGIDAVPFLLPLMFQVGFGLDAFHAGLLVIAVFGGNLAMKPATTGILRRFGFKPVLLVNGLLNVALLLACALLTPGTPAWLVALLLFCVGLTRSMQFTALNTLAFSDIAQQRMAAANTLFSTIVQVAMGLGIALGAVGVRFGHWLSGMLGLDRMPAADFRLAFLLVGLVSLLGLGDMLKLAPLAGNHLARRR
ncbi:MFS transporter [Janthinobacterium agaricidamnosum]|uniref:Major Facilitator Superfamily protein n=1 Tax=Janthinobacterium agaricidamnosum NBRC 102515 = DSM 9628 TaxID=1349767 RepID=W0V4A4_9BURK|nr:MFS transporter [Janthinobacterium agaricidamnosum]CDG83659.1 major Facilitator Superfamily protein [Janthinobacterium agaricidamnosum NBRC 102515 = DSM 9628]